MGLNAPSLSLSVLSSLVDLGAELQAEVVDLPRVLELATGNAARLLGTDIAWLALYDDETHTMRVAVSCGVSCPEFDRMQVSEHEGLGGAAIDRRGPVIVGDYPAWAAPGPVRDAMLQERVASVVCAPMLRGDRAVGVLYVGNRVPTDFSESDAAIVTALAAQASVAIGNGLLYSSLLDKTRTLEATFEIHRELGEAAVSDLGVDRVMRTLSEVTGRSLLLEQRIVPPFELLTEPALGVAAVDADEDDRVATVVSIRRNESDVGQITVYGEAPLGELEQNALSHGATVLALELMKHEAAQDVEWRLRGELLEQLLEAEDGPSDDLVARAVRFGIDLTEPCAIVAVEAPALDPPTLRGLIQRVIMGRGGSRRANTTLSGQRGDRGVIALIGDRHDIDKFSQALADAGAGAVLWIGTSSGRSSVAASFREAAACATRTAGKPTQLARDPRLGARAAAVHAGYPRPYERVRVCSGDPWPGGGPRGCRQGTTAHHAARFRRGGRSSPAHR